MTERIQSNSKNTDTSSSKPTAKKRRKDPNTGTIPTRNDRLLTSGDLSLSALIRLGKETGVKHNTAKIVEADLKGARTADSAFLKARTRRLQVLTPAQNLAHAEAGKFIINAKSMMTGELGSVYNQEWFEVGFQDHSLATPMAMPKRMALLKRIATYLADHPRFENAPLHVTAVKGEALHERYTGARDAVLGSKTLEDSLSTARKAKREALRKRISSLQKELGQTLEDNDPLWLSFGITPPADVKEKRRNSRRAKQLQRAAAGGPIGSASAGEPTGRSTSDSDSSEASSVELNG